MARTTRKETGASERNRPDCGELGKRGGKVLLWVLGSGAGAASHYGELGKRGGKVLLWVLGSGAGSANHRDWEAVPLSAGAVRSPLRTEDGGFRPKVQGRTGCG